MMAIAQFHTARSFEVEQIGIGQGFLSTIGKILLQ
jgi:hypothetical protein